MITFLLILAILAIILMFICGVSVLLIDPIIAVLLIWGIYKLVRWIIDS